MSDYIDDDNLWKEDLFATLNVAFDASDAEIKKSYLKLAKKYHPDKYLEENEEKQEALRIFSKITVAYNTLIDPGKKNHYLDLRRLLASHLPENQTAPPPFNPGTAPSPPPASAQAEAPKPQAQSQPQQEAPKPSDLSPSTAAEKVKEEQARSFFNMGSDYMKKNQTDKAIDAFKQAISIHPEIAEFHTQLGMAYKNKSWISMAQAEFKLALKYNPNDRTAKTNFTGNTAAPKDKKPEPESKGLFSSFFKFGKKK